MQNIRNPSPFFLLRPFFESSCPIQNDTSPARRDTPTTFPPSSQVCSTANPRTSRYQARLAFRSPTVRLGDASLSASNRLAAGGVLRGADFVAAADKAEREGDFFARADFAGFLAAMLSSSRRRRLFPGTNRVKGSS